LIAEIDFEKALQCLGPRVALPRTSGVYLIANTVTGWVYVGRSKNMHGRAGAHISILRGGASDCIEMLADFREHGEDSMQFAVIAEIDDPKQLDESESVAIAMAVRRRDCYNKLGIASRPGKPEVRGIFAPPELHSAIKEAARKLVAKSPIATPPADGGGMEGVK
jgi:hypothetical protein